MLRILLDENFNRRILLGLIKQLPRLDYVIAQETDMEGSTDLDLLAWAAATQRVIVTHDVNTMPKYAYQRLQVGGLMTGVIRPPEDLAIGIAIEELAILIECSEKEELVAQVKYVPL